MKYQIKHLSIIEISKFSLLVTGKVYYKINEYLRKFVTINKSNKSIRYVTYNKK